MLFFKWQNKTATIENIEVRCSWAWMPQFPARQIMQFLHCIYDSHWFLELRFLGKIWTSFEFEISHLKDVQTLMRVLPWIWDNFGFRFSIGLNLSWSLPDKMRPENREKKKGLLHLLLSRRSGQVTLVLCKIDPLSWSLPKMICLALANLKIDDSSIFHFEPFSHRLLAYLSASGPIFGTTWECLSVSVYDNPWKSLRSLWNDF